MIVIPIQNQHSYDSIPRNKDLKLSIGNHCNSPSRVLVVDWKGDCFVCACEAWLPISVGRITDFSHLSQVWSNSTARDLQQDIDQGLFSHCAVDRCGVVDHDIVQEPYLISINIDESCNLRCPSCRDDTIMLIDGSVYESKLSQVEHLVDLLEVFEQPAHIVMSGNGDPLASAIMRPLLHRFRPRSNHTIRLFTNGLLLIKQLDNNPITRHITQYFISIDAGSESVYEKVRLGGRWDNLRKNLDWLQTVAQDNQAEVLLKFVLQKHNYHDMQNFAQLCIDYGFSGVINRLEDWGTWPDFAQHDVIGNELHAEHPAAMQSLKAVYQEFGKRIQFNASLAALAS